ncbi:uncharacterized protein BDZ99DRAFT_519958 [Mytilinidion resinicola]|uniref:Uncharacterized protein n=1 Tax=Mytilinidion resinicola TaxID=574789 RepID=A0A6A6YM39_9PEZI|nr:uncharacterized protein BDZ99DRAFT_519958 [Mytilinidion resinicola]KAF2809860.1 hypothetical protein BDZ99DRAFT_519958 [Mytilinidion resinicola]
MNEQRIKMEGEQYDPITNRHNDHFLRLSYHGPSPPPPHTVNGQPAKKKGKRKWTAEEKCNGRKNSPPAPRFGGLSRLAWKEHQHQRREEELSRVMSGEIAPPPGAGPNWAKNRESKLRKDTKATKRRHKKHKKRLRNQAMGIDTGDHWSPGMEYDDLRWPESESPDHGVMGKQESSASTGMGWDIKKENRDRAVMVKPEPGVGIYDGGLQTFYPVDDDVEQYGSYCRHMTKRGPNGLQPCSSDNRSSDNRTGDVCASGHNEPGWEHPPKTDLNSIHYDAEREEAVDAFFDALEKGIAAWK